MGMMGVAQENIHLHGRIELDETFIRTGHKSLTAEELGDIADFSCQRAWNGGQHHEKKITNS